jgi:hypothetical protein
VRLPVAWTLCLLLGVVVLQVGCRQKSAAPIQVTVLGIDGCENAASTTRLVQEQASDLGLSLDLRSIVVETREQARRERFPGSPTVLVEGRDIDPATRESEDFGLT